MAPEIRTEGDVTIVPVLEEVLVVEKRLVLKEELHIRRRVAAETVEITPFELVTHPSWCIDDADTRVCTTVNPMMPL